MRPFYSNSGEHDNSLYKDKLLVNWFCEIGKERPKNACNHTEESHRKQWHQEHHSGAKEKQQFKLYVLLHSFKNIIQMIQHLYKCIYSNKNNTFFLLSCYKHEAILPKKKKITF